MPIVPLLVIAGVAFVAVVGAQVFAEPLPPAAGSAGGPGPCQQENPHAVGIGGRAVEGATRGGQSGSKFGPIGAAVGVVLGWGRSIMTDMVGSIRHNVECRGQNESGRVIPNQARHDCKDRCDERYENHNLIGPGGRPWRDCRDACRDMDDPGHHFASPGMDAD